MKEPLILVGLMATADRMDFHLLSPFLRADGTSLPPGRYAARADRGTIVLTNKDGRLVIQGPEISLFPEPGGEGRFTLGGVTIGMGFHWQQQQDLVFQGELHLRLSQDGGVVAINRVPLEAYLSSVLGSEMSATAPLEFLKAHAVISRSWALRQMAKTSRPSPTSLPAVSREDKKTIHRWTGVKVHRGFDVCADDHCQRYHGVFEGETRNAERAVLETRGEVLAFGDEICDTRYSKCCGGMTENFSAAWEDRDIPYLRARFDNDGPPPGYLSPLSAEENARLWIEGFPEAFCNLKDRESLASILPRVDRRTEDFYRWKVQYTQEEISRIVAAKTGRELGAIRDLVPLERGASGRIVRLRIVGTRETLTVGKELQIRSVLSPTHLYSSAFIVRKGPERNGIPGYLRLVGAGWGHGVGLCQIGAAVMAIQGRTYLGILQHYFPGTTLRRGYGEG